VSKSTKLEELRAFRGSSSKSSGLEFGNVAAALDRSAGIVLKAARLLQVSPYELNKFIKDNPDIEQVVMQSKRNTVDLAKEKLIEKIKEGNLRAITYYLSTVGKDEFSTRQELTGADGEKLFEATEDDKDQIIAHLLNVKQIQVPNTDEKDTSIH